MLDKVNGGTHQNQSDPKTKLFFLLPLSYGDILEGHRRNQNIGVPSDISFQSLVVYFAPRSSLKSIQKFTCCHLPADAPCVFLLPDGKPFVSVISLSTVNGVVRTVAYRSSVTGATHLDETSCSPS